MPGPASPDFPTPPPSSEGGPKDPRNVIANPYGVSVESGQPAVPPTESSKDVRNVLAEPYGQTTVSTGIRTEADARLAQRAELAATGLIYSDAEWEAMRVKAAEKSKQVLTGGEQATQEILNDKPLTGAYQTRAEQDSRIALQSELLQKILKGESLTDDDKALMRSVAAKVWGTPEGRLALEYQKIMKRDAKLGPGIKEAGPDFENWIPFESGEDVRQSIGERIKAVQEKLGIIDSSQLSDEAREVFGAFTEELNGLANGPEDSAPKDATS